jgi:hypothetical protein
MPQDPSVTADAQAASLLTGRLGAVLPALRRVTDWLRYLSVAAAVGAVGVWAALFTEGAVESAPRAMASGLALLILLIPPTVTLVAAWSLRDVLTLPERLRGSARTLAAAGRAQPPVGRGRALGLFGALWRLRSVLAEARGSALRVGALARMARMGSLAFVAALAVAVVLDGVLIAAAAVLFVARVLGGA